MKYTFLSICLMLLLAACSDKIELEDDQAKTFNKLYGNSGDDRAVDVRELDDGSILIFGTIETAGKSTELALIKTDRFGNELWTKTFGRDGEDIAGGMDINQNGNIIMTGTTFIQGTTESDSNHSDIIVVELDAEGNLIEERVFSEYLDNEVGACVVYDFSSIGGYIIGGSSDAFSTYTEAGSDFDNPKFTKNLFFVRVFNENGSLQTNPTLAGYEGEDFITNGTRLKFSGNDNFVFSGGSFKDGINSAVYIPVTNKNESSSNIFGIIDFNYSDASVASDVISTSNSFSVLCNLNPNSNSRVILNEIDTLNLTSILNSIDIQKNGSVKGHGFLFNEQIQRFIIVGATNVSQGGGFDHYIASINSDGNINWEETYGGSGEEEALAIMAAKDGGYIITGYTGFEGNSLINTIKVDNKGILNP